MALDSLALQTDGLEVGVGGGIGGLGCRYRADGCFSQRFCFYYFCRGLRQLASTYPRRCLHVRWLVLL